MSSVPLSFEQLGSYSPMDFLTPHYRQQLHASLQYLQRPAGTLLLHKGERSLAQYYLLSGKVAVDAGPARQTFEGGSPQAHMPLNGSQPNPATVKALTDVSLFAVEHQLLERLLGWSQEAAYQVSSLGGMVEEQADEDWLARLLGTPLFGRLAPSHLHALLARFDYVEVEAGQRVVSYGEPGEHFYVIKRGRASISLPSAYSEQPALTLGEGEFFGEEALISGAVRSASVTMLEAGELARLHREDFVELVRPTLIPQISRNELARLSQQGSRKYLLLDVRLALEYRLGHQPESLNLPVANLRTHADSLDRDTSYVVTPEGGIRSELAVHLLNQLGFDAYLLGEQPPLAA
ncbi:cyclic nucleotide-binding domain-containing protein [Pseudomonas sp. R-28-1W-6]|uniref:cyclic nucleotide-binding domain-containing protein n=1 Tax=Pseudomonas sp. R-28-1W-6 TaxID=2650101 RepID=UPI001365B377|nr:cyclic nucleotide-binding domain-containing protein [Pseudomonas sp. R-28-1W-6]MWV10498.1 cyclic nucleotide-binding domain-containing protein [Pseudomonas sp. R-28-1W-6]